MVYRTKSMKLKREVRASRGLMVSQKLVFCHKIQFLDACRHKMRRRSKKIYCWNWKWESCVLTLVTIVCRLVVQSRSHGPYAHILVHAKETHKHTGSRSRCFIERKASQRSLKWMALTLVKNMHTAPLQEKCLLLQDKPKILANWSLYVTVVGEVVNVLKWNT